MTMVATALIPQHQAKRHCKEVCMLVILGDKELPEKLFNRLQRRHFAVALKNPNTGEAFISIPYDHNRAESVLGMLTNDGIKVKRSPVSRESINATIEWLEVRQEAAPKAAVHTATA